MSPHSQLLIAAATVGGVIVLAVGMLLGTAPGLSDGDRGTDPTLVRVSVMDLDITLEPDTAPGDDAER